GSSWRENKLGLVFSSADLRTRRDGVTHDILRKEYVPYIGSVDQFKEHLFECAVRHGYGRYEQTIIVSDGAAWIRNMGDELFPDAVQILDFYHLAENIYSFGKYLFQGDEKQYTPWAEELIGLLRNSGAEEVMKRLEGYKGKALPAGVVNPYTYLEHNRNKIDYADYKRRGYYIGSGPIESGNKTVVQKRCKQAGMRWNESTAQDMVTLKAKEESGLWGASVRDFIMAA
ncbi:MAG: ISKra4 family transposase, partial [Spirochaetaceae bacterium]|nr:ISKra4 family transposase [Spirochaetaceae bacterium]